MMVQATRETLKRMESSHESLAVDSFGLCTVSDVFEWTLTAKTYFHIEKMIREDKDRHAESTKQKAAFVFPSEEPPPWLWSMPLLKSEIAALSITVPQRDSTCHSTLTWALNSLLCVPESTQRHSNKQINTHMKTQTYTESSELLVLFLTWRKERPGPAGLTNRLKSIQCTRTWKENHRCVLYATWQLNISD